MLWGEELLFFGEFLLQQAFLWPSGSVIITFWRLESDLRGVFLVPTSQFVVLF